MQIALLDFKLKLTAVKAAHLRAIKISYKEVKMENF